MADTSERTSWSGLVPMDPVRQPERVTRADVPRLSDRIRSVWDPRYRSRRESALCWCGVSVLLASSYIVRGTHTGAARKWTELVVTIVLVLTIETFALLKNRFRD